MMVPVPSLVALTSVAAAVASVSGFVQQPPPPPASASVRGTTTAMPQSVTVAVPLGHTLPSSRRISSLFASFDDSSSSNSNNNQNQPSPSPSDTNSNSNNNLPPNNSNSNTRYTTNQYHGIELPSADEMMDNSISELRQLRWEREAYILSKFASGDELQELRKEGSRIRQELAEWKSASSSSSSKAASAAAGQSSKESSYIRNLEKQLHQINERDAEFMYCIAKELMIQARNDGDATLEEKYEVQMKEAALGIPQLNMHGLWVGKYGDHGYEMINITYAGETLIATKVTGDRNVPKGEVTFTVDLAPQILSSYASSSSSSSDGQQNQQQQNYHYVSSTLEPIQLDAKAQSQWGKKYLPRFIGKGRVASENFTNAQWMEGQLILVGRFFSFAWVPIGTQIFFGRPSSDLILSMVNEDRKEEMKKRDDVEVMRGVVNDMWEETYWVEKENVQDVLYEEEGCFQ